MSIQNETSKPMSAEIPASGDTEVIITEDVTAPHVILASTLEGEKVINPNMERIGSIGGIMLDVSRGRIAYAVLSVGGFMGIGEKLFAVPWGALKIEANEHRFVLDVDKQRLQNAPGFDKDDWPAAADHDLIVQVHSYFNAHPYWEG